MRHLMLLLGCACVQGATLVLHGSGLDCILYCLCGHTKLKQQRELHTMCSWQCIPACG